MTDIKLGTNNDFEISNGSFLLIDQEEVLVRQRLLNKLRAFTGTLFTNVNYGVEQTLFFERGTKTLLDQNIKEIISDTKGVSGLISFESVVGVDRNYRVNFVYSVETGAIEGIEGLAFGTDGAILEQGVWKNGVYIYNGTWENEELWGEGESLVPEIQQVNSSFEAKLSSDEYFIGGNILPDNTREAKALEDMFEVVREGVATYFDSDGDLQNAAPNTLRVDHEEGSGMFKGLLCEESRTNLLLNSGSPSTQNVTLTAGTYTLSVTGTGQCDVSGLGSAFEKYPLTFQAEDGVLTFTVIGSLSRFQLEQGGYSTSYIPTTGSPVTRGEETLSAKSTAPWVDQKSGTLLIKTERNPESCAASLVSLGDGAGDNILEVTDTFISYPNVTNYMPSPFDPSGWTDGGNGTVDNVPIENPSGETVLGLAVQDGTSFFTMQDSFLNDLSIIAGERLYISIILKPVDLNPFDISIVIGGAATPIKVLKVAVENLSVRSSTMTDYKITDLGNGFKIFEAYWLAEVDDADTFGRYTFTASNSGLSAPIGSQLYVQAAFFGKADDWPAKISNIKSLSNGSPNTTGDSYLPKEDNTSNTLALSYDDTSWLLQRQGHLGYKGVNYMPSPFDPEGWRGASDPDGTIINVVLDNPSGRAVVGLAEQTGVGALGLFNDYSTRQSFNSGVTLYTAIMYKIVSTGGTLGLTHSISSAEGNRSYSRFNIETKEKIAGSADHFRFTDLTDGFVLLEVAETLTSDATLCYGSIVLGSTLNADPAPIGSKLYVQAAFFGKNPLSFPYASYNEFGSDAELSEWTPTRCDISVVNSSLKFLANADDPFITKNIATGLTAFDGSKYTDISVKWRKNVGSSNNQLFFGNGVSTFSINFNVNNPDTRAVTSGPDESGFYTTIFSLENDANWNGTNGDKIATIRLDMGNLADSDVDIEHIKIYDPIELDAYNTYWPAILPQTSSQLSGGVTNLPIFNELKVGNGEEGNHINGHIKSLEYYPRKMESEELTEKLKGF